jgi:hypothetical protein
MGSIIISLVRGHTKSRGGVVPLPLSLPLPLPLLLPMTLPLPLGAFGEPVAGDIVVVVFLPLPSYSFCWWARANPLE